MRISIVPPPELAGDVGFQVPVLVPFKLCELDCFRVLVANSFILPTLEHASHLGPHVTSTVGRRVLLSNLNLLLLLAQDFGGKRWRSLWWIHIRTVIDSALFKDLLSIELNRAILLTTSATSIDSIIL